jgi:hypothetical protein
MNPLLSQEKSPTHVDESQKDDTGYTYVGFCLPGTKHPSEPKFLVKRIEVRDSITSILYAAGSLKYNQRWSERYSLDYSYPQA